MPGFVPQFAAAVGGGMRLGGQQPGIDVRRFPAAARRPAQRRAVRGFTLPEHQIIRSALDDLTRLQEAAEAARNHASRVTNQPIKIRNEKGIERT